MILVELVTCVQVISEMPVFFFPNPLRTKDISPCQLETEYLPEGARHIQRDYQHQKNHSANLHYRRWKTQNRIASRYTKNQELNSRSSNEQRPFANVEAF